MLFALLFLFSVPPAQAQEASLRVEIDPDQASVMDGGELTVTTHITNTGSQDIALRVWTCSYSDNWIDDSPFVDLVPWPCDENGLAKYVLKPGESLQNYENKLRLRIFVPADEIAVEQVTFKLGFKASPDKADTSPVAWSGPITVQVKE